ncbi:MAG: GntR family transcriptional regulator [Phycisphaerae bacterium]|nr:GntR family transcriptional regulator [Phycisphaerae bacterium]
MMQPGNGNGRNQGTKSKSTRLSYKFQRLREQIRSAVVNGQFHDRLPGERELGRMFEANAKTINKALCDLTSEGLLVRQIGRGTFVAPHHGGERARRLMRLTCFMPEPGAETYLQKRIFDAVQKDAVVEGHRIERATYDETGAVQLRDWTTAMRRCSEGILCIPGSPLSGQSGHISEGLMLEAHRRRVQIVVLGACASESKLNAVVPDFVDAGFRLCEHLYRLGCDTVVAVHGFCGREVEAVINGCRTAAGRYSGSFKTCPLRSMEAGVATDMCIDTCYSEAAAARDRGTVGPTVGIVLIGLEALRFARANERLMKRWRSGEIALTTVLDPGDTLAADMEMTAYEIPTDRIAAWGIKLIGEVTSGQRPVEVLIPGVLKVRNSISPEAPHAGSPRATAANGGGTGIGESQSPRAGGIEVAI